MLVFIIAIYKRHALTKVVLDYYRELQKKYPFKIVIAGSEGKKSQDLANGFEYIETPNFPISNKNNAMMLKAKELNPDAVVLLGSDDFICENVIKYYYKLIKQNENSVVGFYDLYFYSTAHEILSHFDCGNKSYGAGRYFPKYVLEKINYKGWYGSFDRGLDGNNMKLIQSNQIESKVIKLSDIDGLLVDIKHDFNISNKNIIFVGKQVNKNIMARKKIPTEKIDALPIEKVKKVDEPIKTIDESLNLDPRKLYTFVSNGKSRFIKEGECEFNGYECEIFIKKGYGSLKK